MTDKAQDQIHHMLALERLGLAQAGFVFEDHAKGVAVGHVEKRER